MCEKGGQREALRKHEAQPTEAARGPLGHCSSGRSAGARQHSGPHSAVNQSRAQRQRRGQPATAKEEVSLSLLSLLSSPSLALAHKSPSNRTGGDTRVIMHTTGVAERRRMQEAGRAKAAEEKEQEETLVVVVARKRLRTAEWERSCRRPPARARSHAALARGTPSTRRLAAWSAARQPAGVPERRRSSSRIASIPSLPIPGCSLPPPVLLRRLGTRYLATRRCACHALTTEGQHAPSQPRQPREMRTEAPAGRGVHMADTLRQVYSGPSTPGALFASQRPFSTRASGRSLRRGARPPSSRRSAAAGAAPQSAPSKGGGRKGRGEKAAKQTREKEKRK